MTMPETATFKEWMDWAGIATTKTEAEYYQHVGAQIRLLREQRGWTQVRLAVELGYDSSVVIHYWETAARRPSAYIVDRLERLFGAKVRP